MKKAVALKYSADVPAPFILSRGKRELADRLLRLAEEHGITIVEDREVTDALFQFEPGTFIPEHMYELVAQLLAFVYALEHGNENMKQDGT